MNKLFQLVFLITLLFTGNLVNASFQPIKSTLYFENQITREITYYETISYSTKEIQDEFFLRYLDGKSLGKDLIFDKWLIKEYCLENKCYEVGVINKGGYAISLDHIFNNTSIEVNNIKDKSVISKFDFNEVNFSEKFSNLYVDILKSLGIEFLIFFPLNLIIFFCIGYLVYMIFSKYIKYNSYIFIYTVSFFTYLIVFITLYYYGLGFVNFSTGLFGFMSYFFVIGFFKFIFLLISKYTIEKFKRDNKIESNFETNIFLYYGVLFLISMIYLHVFK